MAAIYWKYVKNGTKKFSEIPESVKEAVKKLAVLEVENGTISGEVFDGLMAL